MPITGSVLYDLVSCPQRVALDAFANSAARDEISPFVRLLWERGTVFERETIAGLHQAFTDLSPLQGVEKENQTIEAMRRGDKLIYSGRIASDDLLGLPDLLRREIDGYVPVDIKSAAGEEGGTEDHDGRPKVHYAVQLGLYIDILERLGLSAGRRGFVWDIHGDEVLYDFGIPLGAKTETLWDEYQWALGQARAILARQITPQPAYAGVCKLCHWYSFCIGQLTDADDLTLIPYLGRSLRDVMLGRVPSIATFAASDPESFIDGKKTVFKGLGSDRLRRFHARAVMLKSPTPTPFLRAPITLGVVPVELFFDVEVDPWRDFCYLHGVVERHNGNNESEQFIYFFADEVTPASERDAFAAAFSYLNRHAESTIYFYSKYERTIYRKLQRKYPEVCSSDDVERLFTPPRSIDLYGDVVLKATEWPTRDHSIKTLAQYLGFTWRDNHPSGAASIEWFDRWTRGRDPAVKKRILEYNEDDCRATRVLLDGIRALAN